MWSDAKVFMLTNLLWARYVDYVLDLVRHGASIDSAKKQGLRRLEIALESLASKSGWSITKLKQIACKKAAAKHIDYMTTWLNNNQTNPKEDKIVACYWQLVQDFLDHKD